MGAIHTLRDACGSAVDLVRTGLETFWKPR